jgi:hypothetical protein
VSSTAAVDHGSRKLGLHKSRKLAQSCHSNSKKEREGCEGEESEVEGRSSEALLVLRFILGISLISTHLVPVVRCNESIICIDSLDFFRFVV